MQSTVDVWCIKSTKEIADFQSRELGDFQSKELGNFQSEELR